MWQPPTTKLKTDEVTPSGSKSTEVSNEPLSGMEDERQITSEGVPVGELHNDIGTVFQRAKHLMPLLLQSKPYPLQISFSC